MRHTQRGFTLLEILISMSLFTMIGFAVVLLMGTGVDMWIQGTRGSQQEDRLEGSLPRLEEDLRMTRVPSQRQRIPFDPKNPDPEKEPDPLPPDNRFLSGYLPYRLGDKEVPCRFLAFVRDIAGMSEIDTYVQRAGTNPKAEAYIDGKDDEKEFKQNLHLPTAGAAEVLWIWLPDESRPGVGAVYRAYRTPIGGAGSLLDTKNYDSRQKLLRDIRPLPMFQNVILFDLLFWTQYTTHWSWEAGDPAVRGRPTDPGEIKAGRPACGPSRTWDSTRGLMPGGNDGFHLTRGKDSFRFAGDDIWPRMVRIEFALNEEETTLGRAVTGANMTFMVDAGAFATGRGELRGKPMKLATEWVVVEGRDGRARDVFNLERRGMRGTKTLNHSAGEPVYFGRLIDFTITVPSFRDDNN